MKIQLMIWVIWTDGNLPLHLVIKELHQCLGLAKKREIVSGHLGVDGQNVLRAVGVELDNEQGGWQDVQKMVATDVLEEVGQQNHVLWEKHVQNEKVAMIDLVWDVDYMLEEITAMAGTKNGWEETAGNLAKYVVEPWADQQDNAAITIGHVEDFLVGVILGTGDKDSGWPETAGKLAEDVEQRDH